MTASHTPDAIRNIARWAGKLSPAEIADRLGFSLSFVERAAGAHKISLHMDAGAAPTPIAARRGRERPRAVTANLSNADHDALLAKAENHNLPPATTLAAILRGAIATNSLDLLIVRGRKGLRS